MDRWNVIEVFCNDGCLFNAGYFLLDQVDLILSKGRFAKFARCRVVHYTIRSRVVFTLDVESHCE